MKKSLIFNLYKQIGETPLERLGRFKKSNPEYKDIPLTYAGRLDPMAEGVLLVLGGETVKKKEDFLSLPKRYSFEVLWGFETDTFDLLGKVTKSHNKKMYLDPNKFKNTLKKLRSLEEMEYPPFSSKTLNGQPLFSLARSGALEKSKLPRKKIKIYKIEHLKTFKKTKSQLEIILKKKISLVKGDFRQKEIMEVWEKKLKDYPENFFWISRFRADVSSGTYIRRLSDIFGKELEVGGTTLSIIREKLGDFSIKQSEK